MKLKIGVMGSATGNLSKGHKELAYALGCAIANNDCITITGACPGYPHHQLTYIIAKPKSFLISTPHSPISKT